jgi:hypothetical protein
MNKNFVPTPADKSLLIESAISKSANFAGTKFDMGSGFAPGGLGQPVAAVVDVATFSLGGSTGASIWTATLTESSDDNTYTACGPDVVVDASKVLSIPGFLSQRYVKLKLTLSGGTGTGTLGLSAWLQPLGFAAAR